MEGKAKRPRNERFPGGRTDILALIEGLPVDERRAASGALKVVRGTPGEDALCDVLAARRRTEQRRQSDRLTDSQRRRLVGARVSRAVAEMCKDAAANCGLSLNAWTTRALMAALKNTQTQDIASTDRQNHNPWYGW